MFGYERAELIGRNIGALSSGIYPYTQEVAIEQLRRASIGEIPIFIWQCKTKDGALFWTEISIRYTEIGNVPAVVAVLRDITERKKLDARIAYMSDYDLLTGLANQSRFTTILDGAIARSLRTGKKCALLYLDLDHFEDINDTRGRLTGDHLLLLVAKRLQGEVRSDTSVAHFGGDEFAVLQEDAGDPAEIAALANRLIVSISHPFLIDGDEMHISVSVGVAIYGEDAKDAETLLTNANIALHRAKRDGGRCYQFFSPAMNEEVRSRVKLTDELRVAIPAGQLCLEYQPQVRAKGGHIIGVEALVRWRHPQRGILLPACFLPVAESSGLSGALFEWVLWEACRQGRQWIDAGIAPSTISMNLSSAQFKSPLELERVVFAALEQMRIPPKMLELEITESTLINLSAQHEATIKKLRRRGVRFSLDDFGTGYSSLNYFRRISIDRIKIPREFVSDLSTSTKAASIVKLILSLSRSFGSEVIAEGVETLEQFKLLQDWDCPDVQGFYFANPMSAEALLPLLSSGKIKSERKNGSTTRRSTPSKTLPRDCRSASSLLTSKSMRRQNAPERQRMEFRPIPRV